MRSIYDSIIRATTAQTVKKHLKVVNALAASNLPPRSKTINRCRKAASVKLAIIAAN